MVLGKLHIYKGKNEVGALVYLTYNINQKVVHLAQM